MSSEINYVAAALMKAWFPKYHQDQGWLESEDGKAWTEIALLDADIACKACKEWIINNGDDLK